MNKKHTKISLTITTTRRYHFTANRMATVQKSETRVVPEVENFGPLVQSWCGCEMVLPRWKRAGWLLTVTLSGTL